MNDTVRVNWTKLLARILLAVSVIGFLILLVCASMYMVSTLKKGDE